MVVMGVLVAALSEYAMANHKATTSYRKVRDQRFAAESAINQAINWAKDQPTTGRDPSLPITSTPCVTQVPATIGGKAVTVTSSCAAESGSGSGKPADTGMLPPEGLVLLGARQNEPGPYNAPGCSGFGNVIGNFFSSAFTGADTAEHPSQDVIKESSLRFKVRSALGGIGITCSSVNRGATSTFQVRNSAVAAGRIDTSGLTIQAVAGSLQARGGCNFAGCVGVTTRSGYTGDSSYLNGSARDTDPGRTNPASPARNSPGDIAAPWRSVAFNNDGSVRDLGYTATTVMPSRLPQRTTAYFFNPADGTVNSGTGITGCSGVGNGTTIVFLPGWYRNASFLNNFTADPACAGFTLWFAPDPGPDGKLLTADDQTGGYYFDFTQGSADNCNSYGADARRWCVGGSKTSSGNASQTPRIVVGTPQGWTPRGSSANGAGTGTDPNATPTTYRIDIPQANTVDDDLSQSWTNAAGAKLIGDNSYATYRADICIFGFCFSQDRAIRVRDFTPDVTGQPVAIYDGSGTLVAPKGRVYLKVRYAVKNPTSANSAKAVIEAVSAKSGRKSCGTYDLITDRAATDSGANASSSVPPTWHDYTFTDAQAKQLADACGQVDLINGLEVKITITGNNFNQPKTDWFLDGVDIFYDSYAGASFPDPTSSGISKAKSDCDPAKPGGQFIFGGESNMFIADGSAEICAGPYPVTTADFNAGTDNYDKHQSIGIWALPAVSELAPSGDPSQGADTSSFPGGDPGGRIADIDGYQLNIKYNSCFFCTRNADANMTMPAYSVPTGYVISKVTARFAYNPKNPCFFTCALGTAAQFKEGSCGFQDVLKGNTNIHIANDYPRQVLYDASTGTNCIGVNGGRTSYGSHTFTWRARCSACITGGTDYFDGVKYQVTLAPADTSVPRAVPQSGCIVAHPNYSSGAGKPDCALVRAVLATASDGATIWTGTRETGESRGRLSVKGTIWAPSSAIEVDDTDNAYPLATRGAVLRHLRLSGFRFRSGYSSPPIDDYVDQTPAPREAIFTACISTSAHLAARAPCQTGDKILARARVRFEIDGAMTDPAKRARIPKITAWTTVF